MDRASNPGEDARGEIIALLTTWLAAAEPESAAILRAVEAKKRALEAAAPPEPASRESVATGPVPPPPPKPAPKRAPKPTPSERHAPAEPSPPPAKTAAPARPKPAPIAKPPTREAGPAQAEDLPAAAETIPAPGREPAAPSAAGQRSRPEARPPQDRARKTTAPARRPKTRPPSAAEPGPVWRSALVAWLVVVGPVVLVALALAVVATLTSGEPGPSSVELSLSPAPSRDLELGFVGSSGRVEARVVAPAGAAEARLELEPGSYDVYLDRRYSGVRVTVPGDRRVALSPLPPLDDRTGSAEASETD